MASPSEPPPTLDVVASQHIKDAHTLTLASDQQGRKVLERINNVRDQKIGTQPEKRTRRGRGKRKDKVTNGTQDGRENVPPPASQQNTLSRPRRARGSGYVDIGTRPARRRGRATSSVGGAETAKVVNNVTSQFAETVEDSKATGGDDQVDRPQRDGGVRSRQRARRRMPSQGDGRGLGFVPKPDKDIAKTADGLTSENPENSIRSGAPSPCGETRLPQSTTEGDVSTVLPLPSSTRRRAKEYFQRRTRERSVDAVGRQHARPPRRCVTIGELQVPRSPLDLEGGAVNEPARRSGSVPDADAKRDQFVFDPEASPFTPNATSSPRQPSPSSIGVQSLPSPTPLPSHGNRKVVPLVLPEASNRSTSWQGTKRDSVPQLIPTTSHGITNGLAYTYAGANQAQQLQAEQIAIMRLQAYYNLLAGSMPAPGVGVGVQVCEHMDMSGGGGGLSGGVALGRPAQIQGRGKGQCRNASGAYAHPKEHVVFSPRDHEQTEGGSRPALQQTGIGEGEKGPGHKWDGKWGLRPMAASGKEIGWSWGTGGTDLWDRGANET